VRDDHRNGNNRFEVASRLNSEVSRGFGPFFGRPPKASEAVADHLSPRRDGFFRFPLSLRNGSQVLALRETDLRARSSSPWFLFGDPNSAGGQALVGIPRVARLREAIPGARIWPFETGGMTKGLAPARVLLAEVYPSLFHRRQAGREIHDRLQVESSVLAFARLDAQGFLAKLFATPKDPSIVHEEGWILG
jgi:precorrin-8X/cobalt-precorrin-8 methylmutase